MIVFSTVIPTLHPPKKDKKNELSLHCIICFSYKPLVLKGLFFLECSVIHESQSQLLLDVTIHSATQIQSLHQDIRPCVPYISLVHEALC